MQALRQQELGEMDSALGLFDVVIAGVILNDQADAQVENGQPWDVGPGDEPDPNDGHAILLIKSDAAAGPSTWCRRNREAVEIPVARCL